MNNDDIRIDQMGIHLPESFKARANNILRLLGDELSSLVITESREIRRMDIPPLRVGPHDSDRFVAGKIAKAVERAINERGRL